jgi:hypothetical protein
MAVSHKVIKVKQNCVFESHHSVKDLRLRFIFKCPVFKNIHVWNPLCETLGFVSP